MKYIYPVLFILFFGCKADVDIMIEAIDHPIIGKWQLEATKISPGGIVDWTEVSNGEIQEFKSNGTFELSKSSICPKLVNGTFNIFEDQLTLEFKCDSNINVNGYYFRFNDNKLILSFIGCIEECSYRYKPL